MRTRRPTLAAFALLAILSVVPAAAGVPEGKAAWAAGDYAAAIVQLRPPAEAGDAEAQFYLGEAYRLGRGVTADTDLAIVWYRRSAALGNARARDALGLTLFASGKRPEAIPLLEKAAEGGDARALYVLGTAHFNGDNTTRDWPLAYAMMMRASANGLPQAKTSLDVMDRYLFPADKVRAQQLYAGMSGGTPAPASASAAPARPAAIAVGGAWKVQLGAFGSADRAETAWTSLSAKVPALKRLDRHVIEAGPVRRLQAWNLADRAAAADLCKAVTAAGGGCLAMAPERR